MTGLVLRLIPEHPVEGKRLGRHVGHDPRSRAFPAARATGTLQKVRWQRKGSVLDQGDLGSCTGNAAAGAVNTRPLVQALPRRPLKEADAVQIYELATTLDALPGTYPPDDEGSTGLAAAKAAKQLGHIGGYTHAFGVDHALAALQLGPVITGVDWHEGFDSPDSNGLVRVAGQVRGGHEFEVVGYDPATGLVEAVNSWGLHWGLRGRFWFTAADWAVLLAAQGDVTVLQGRSV